MIKSIYDLFNESLYEIDELKDSTLNREEILYDSKDVDLSTDMSTTKKEDKTSLIIYDVRKANLSIVMKSFLRKIRIKENVTDLSSIDYLEHKEDLEKILTGVKENTTANENDFLSSLYSELETQVEQFPNLYCACAVHFLSHFENFDEKQKNEILRSFLRHLCYLNIENKFIGHHSEFQVDLKNLINTDNSINDDTFKPWIELGERIPEIFSNNFGNRLINFTYLKWKKYLDDLSMPREASSEVIINEVEKSVDRIRKASIFLEDSPIEKILFYKSFSQQKLIVVKEILKFKRIFNNDLVDLIKKISESCFDLIQKNKEELEVSDSLKILQKTYYQQMDFDRIFDRIIRSFCNKITDSYFDQSLIDMKIARRLKTAINDDISRLLDEIISDSHVSLLKMIGLRKLIECSLVDLLKKKGYAALISDRNQQKSATRLLEVCKAKFIVNNRHYRSLKSDITFLNRCVHECVINCPPNPYKVIVGIINNIVAVYNHNDLMN